MAYIAGEARLASKTRHCVGAIQTAQKIRAREKSQDLLHSSTFLPIGPAQKPDSGKVFMYDAAEILANPPPLSGMQGITGRVDSPRFSSTREFRSSLAAGHSEWGVLA